MTAPPTARDLLPRILVAALLAPLLCSCGASEDELSLGPADELAVLREMVFVREEDGVSDAFDLDGRVSTDTDAEGCYHEDVVGLDGEPGIDNTFANVLPALEVAGGAALEPLIQASINDGRLLLMIGLDGIDDRRNDDCVRLRISRGMGAPAVGGDGLILPGQTFDPDPQRGESVVECAELSGGVLRGSSFSLRLELNIFDEYIDLTLLDGVLEMELLPERGYIGRIGGGVSIQEVKDNVASLDGIGDEIPAMIDSILELNADLVPDDWGNCTQMSVTFHFTAASAFYFAEPVSAAAR
ncbi:MAG: hypothetical protein CMP23_15170 [Rickettsiales bacterium]|nr:hypothetical protein [Rickettsiales bacterium]|tara:strand:- start:4321 stop:5217 length:897 start_codon:yes stop_codon:yes gene_type:complete